MADFIQSYFAETSDNSTNPGALEKYYAGTVSYYGGNVPLGKVMTEKRNFAVRWPVRQYSIDTQTFTIQCTSVCTASGVLAWDAKSTERDVHSVGTANIAFQITGTGALAIFSENGAVIRRNTFTLSTGAPLETFSAPAPAAGVAPVSQAFADGRAARLHYEEWVSKLPGGDYRDGVMFWAGNRSKKPLPVCAGVPSVDWLNGCIAARDRLNPIDARRRSEKDFWLGWNSL